MEALLPYTYPLSCQAYSLKKTHKLKQSGFFSFLVARLMHVFGSCVLKPKLLMFLTVVVFFFCNFYWLVELFIKFSRNFVGNNVLVVYVFNYSYCVIFYELTYFAKISNCELYCLTARCYWHFKSLYSIFMKCNFLFICVMYSWHKKDKSTEKVSVDDAR